MLTIYKDQLDQFNNYLKVQFVEETLKEYDESTFNEIAGIVEEALSYLINSENSVRKYVELYMQNETIFLSKPKWMINVLNNESYLAEDKLIHIERSLKE